MSHESVIFIFWAQNCEVDGAYSHQSLREHDRSDDNPPKGREHAKALSMVMMHFELLTLEASNSRGADLELVSHEL